MKVPKIRFKGENSNCIFWKFEILFSYASEWWTPDTNNKNFYLNWDIPFVKIEDTENKYIKNTKSFITKEWLKHSSAWLIPSNNIIFTNGATVWNVAINKIPVATKQGILWIIPNKNIDKEYMYYLLSNTHFQNEVKNRTAKWTFETIILRNLKEIPISLPSLSEQEKIWSLFEQLDSHISKNQQKLEKLKNMKQSFLQKLFPKNWSALPELRFKGFEEAWEEKKLGESLMSIQTWTNLLWWNDEKWTPLLKMWNIQRWFFDLSKLEYIAPQLQVEQENIAYYWDFFFNTRNTLELVGKWATRMWENGKFAFNSNIARFKLKNINTIFFNYLYNTNEIKKQISARAMWTTSVAAIYPTNLYTVEYKIPSLPEQEKIWAFFEKLDTQITQQTQKIQKLQNLKQSLLEKMFI